MISDKKENEVLNLSLEFALKSINVLNTLPKSTSNIVLVKQCLRSSTSIGANIEEANGASTKKDFTRCLVIARKEARETRYWLRLLVRSNKEYRNELIELGNLVTSILKLLNKIISTSRKNG
jgi:four helix bundle protein